MPVHVSIHDVSPRWSAEVEQALELCAQVEARPALLAVPDFHGEHPLLGDARFCDRLRGLQAAGHEVYLHGFRHEADASPARSGLRDRVRWAVAQSVVSAGEAEMACLTEEQGRERVIEGERVLREAGLRLDGYVAPAWAMPGWLLELLAERGVRYTEDHVRVYDPQAGRSRTSVVMNWATRSRARMLSSALWCRAARPARAFLPTRIAIHPADMRVPVVEREVRRALAWAKGDFVAKGADLLL
jgi:predicted deacetylase